MDFTFNVTYFRGSTVIWKCVVLQLFEQIYVFVHIEIKYDSKQLFYIKIYARLFLVNRNL